MNSKTMSKKYVYDKISLDVYSVGKTINTTFNGVAKCSNNKIGYGRRYVKNLVGNLFQACRSTINSFKYYNSLI
jgi:hypothetical protein